MSYLSAIKHGIDVVNKNWQLILIQLVFMIFSFMSFFFIVGVPIAIAFVLFGLDLTEILRLKDVLGVLRDSSELLNKYFGIAILVILSFLTYLLLIVVLWVFTVGGAIGVLTNTIVDETSRFSLNAFFKEGKRFFFPVFIFSGVIGIVFIMLAIILGIIGSVAAAIIEQTKAYEATLALFLGVFFSLVLISVGLLLILLTLSLTVYGIAHIALNRSKPLEALRETIKYLYAAPSSIGFYAILVLGYVVTGFVVILIGSPLALIPVIGSLLSLPYQLVTYAVQGYVGLIMLSATFYYYFKTGYTPVRPESTEGSDTSQERAGEQESVPEQKGEQQ